MEVGALFLALIVAALFVRSAIRNARAGHMHRLVRRV